MGKPFEIPQEQLIVLQAHVKEYLKIYTGSRNYEDFWPKATKAFFDKFPLLPTMFPGKEEKDLTESELDEYRVQYSKTYLRIQKFYQWKSFRHKRDMEKVDTVAESVILPADRKRQYKDYEMYSKMYWQERLASKYEEECKAGSGSKKGAVAMRARIAREEFKKEDAETKRLVNERLKEENDRIIAQRSTSAATELTLDDLTRGIEGIPDYLRAVLSKLSKDTGGWKFMVLMGGPNPLDDGQIQTMTFQEVQHGEASFRDNLPDFRKTIQKPFTKYLKTLTFPPLPAEKSSDNDVNTDLSDDNNDEPPMNPAGGGNSSPLPLGGTSTDGHHNIPSTEIPASLPSMPITNPAVPPCISVGYSGQTLPSIPPPQLHPPPTDSQQTSQTSVAPNMFPLLGNTAAVLNFNSNMHYDALLDHQPYFFQHNNYQSENNRLYSLDAMGGLEPGDVSFTVSNNMHWPALISPVHHQGAQSSGVSVNGFVFPNLDTHPGPDTTNIGTNNIQPQSMISAVPAQTHFGEGSIGGAQSSPDAGYVSMANVSVTASTTITMPPTPPPGSFQTNAPIAAPPIPLPTSSQTSAPSDEPPSAPFISSPASAAVTAPPIAPPTSSQTQTSVPIQVTEPPSVPSISSPRSAAVTVTAPPNPPPTSSQICSPITEPPSIPSISSPTSAAVTVTAPPNPPTVISESSNPITTPPMFPTTMLNTTNQPTPATTICESEPNHPATPVSEQDISRKRVSKPSKRNEVMDKIGTAIPGTAPKEQPANTGIAAENAAYVKFILLQNPLGEEWEECVEAWFSLEANLGYGLVAGTKSGLPAAHRPSEYAKWSSKAKNGERPYKNIPRINDAMEFGLAVTKWYNTIQPSFRQSLEGMPLPTLISPSTAATDPWACMRRAGPNGLVLVMLLLQWWGVALASRTPFQEDSSPLWNVFVIDVIAVFKAIQLSIPTAGNLGKRKRIDNNENIPAKSAHKK